MRISTILRKRSAALVLAAASTGAAAVDLSEQIAGDFSNDRLAPTKWSLGPDSVNVLTGTIGRNMSGQVDRDYVTLEVPVGYQWTQLRVGNQTVASGGQGSFIGLALGPTMPVLPSATTATGLMGWKLYMWADFLQAGGRWALGAACGLACIGIASQVLRSVKFKL
jgi:hypothetical protein